jgi:hypothetical protein
VPPSYHGRNNSDVIRINAQMAALFGPAGTHKEVSGAAFKPELSF